MRMLETVASLTQPAIHDFRVGPRNALHDAAQRNILYPNEKIGGRW
jgi:hypothetical protein